MDIFNQLLESGFIWWSCCVIIFILVLLLIAYIVEKN